MTEKGVKEKIGECAFKLFLSRGIKAVTMDMIAQQIGISKRTLYETFSSKEELLMGVIDTMGNKMLQRGREVLNSDIPSIMKIFHITSLSNDRSEGEKIFWHDVIISYPALAENFNDIFEVLAKKMHVLIAQGIEEGYFYSNINIDNFIAMFSMPKIKFDPSLTAIELLDYHKYGAAVFLRAMSTPKGIDVIDELCIENNINIITGLR